MGTFATIVLFALGAGIGGVAGAAGLLFLPTGMRDRLLPHLVSFAVGVLLGVAALGLLPQALQGLTGANVQQVTGALLGGILLFFVVEKVVMLRHCHSPDCDVHGHPHGPGTRPAALLILFGGSLHNFVDGVLLTAAFLSDVRLGVTAGIAVVLHELPHEIGDVAILIDSGLSPRRAFFYNLITALAMVLGAVLAYQALEQTRRFLPTVLALASASFIYIALADLIPGLHQRSSMRSSVAQVVLVGIGVAMVAAL